MVNIITYGTFDTLHYGHIELLKRAKDLSKGDKLIVGLSTDDFNGVKGKLSKLCYLKRKELLSAIKYVDIIIPEDTRTQKYDDIEEFNAQMVMGDDWKGKFDELGCIYLQRTDSISSTLLKSLLDTNEKQENTSSNA